MRKVFLFLIGLCALSLSAQVTTEPNPIPVGYTGTFKIIFDPMKGSGGMGPSSPSLEPFLWPIKIWQPCLLPEASRA